MESPADQQRRLELLGYHIDLAVKMTMLRFAEPRVTTNASRTLRGSTAAPLIAAKTTQARMYVVAGMNSRAAYERRKAAVAPPSSLSVH